MDLTVYAHYYRCKSADRQQEIDTCLRRNLNHPAISKVVLFKESDAPPLPEATVALEVVESNTRITYAEWFRWVKRQGSGIGLLLNADIYLDEGLEHLAATFDTPESFLALTRYNPGHAGFHLNDYPHWTQDVWGVRADAELPESLLYASSFPLGFPGCDNRIAYVMWSHGFRVRNPCYHVRSVHLQASTARHYDKTCDRLYGGVSYVHPSLAPAEDAELEFTLWTRSEQRPAGVLVNQQAIEQGVHQLRHGEAEVAQRFLDQQQFTGLAWVHEAVGSAHLEGSLNPFASEDTVFLPMPALLAEGVDLRLPHPTRLEGLSIRLPQRATAGYQLELVAKGNGETELQLKNETALALKPGSGRCFWKSAELRSEEWTHLNVKLVGQAGDAGWLNEEGAELILFAEKKAPVQGTKTITSSSPNERSSPGFKESQPTLENEPFTILHREEVKTEDLESVAKFGTRFEVFFDGAALYFTDRFWPSVVIMSFSGTADEARNLGEESLFAMGYLQPIQEWKPNHIATTKQHKDQLLFWQFPCRTEEVAYMVHRSLDGPHLEGDSYQIYVGLPWATFIDRGVNESTKSTAYPEALLLAHRKRVNALEAVLSRWQKHLRVHSVCQHIFWREAVEKIKSAGVTDLWISHKEKGIDEQAGLKLHSWNLFAVNARDPDRRQGLNFVPIGQRPVFAAFSGAHMNHYISDVRQRMASLSQLDGYQISINDTWHFNKVVYNYQVFGDESKKNAIEADDVRNYNELLSHTQFSLCPVGAGPNTLRLWESLAVGSVPVVLSDRHELPDLKRLLPGEALEWDQVVVLHPESELEQLDARLRAIDGAELHRRQRLGRRVYEATVAMTCFGRSEREAEPIPLLQELFKPQQVQIPGQTQAAYTGVARQVPAALLLDPEGPSSIVVHMDQTEQLLGFRLTALGCDLSELSVTISRYREFNKFEELPIVPGYSIPTGSEFWLPAGEHWWAMGIKITATWLEPSSAKAGAELRLAVSSEKDAFSREARRLDRAGILQAASDHNEERKDDTFDTKHINSGLILETLPRIALPKDVIDGNELFPPIKPPTTNLIGEPLSDGITMYVHLMNRNENVLKNLNNWLQQKFDELILLDWSSKEPVSGLPGVFDDPRVRVVRVEGQSKFVRTLAQNLATRMARNHRIFKCDSDVEIKGDFFADHPLEPGEFWVGDWHHARDENEKHLHGETYYFIQDFERVNGYDERILSYGQDDTNLKDRMVLSGLTKKVISLCHLNHQAHEDSLRTTNQDIIHPMVRTYAHRLFTNRSRLFSNSCPRKSYEPVLLSPSLIRFDAKNLATVNDDVGLAYEEQALDIVAGWYTSEDLNTLKREEKLKLIWHQSQGAENKNRLSITTHETIPVTAQSQPPSTPEISIIEAGEHNLNGIIDFRKKQRILILGSSVSIQKEGYLPVLRRKLDALCTESTHHMYLNASLGGTPSEATYCYASSNFVYDIQSFMPTLCIIEKAPNDKIFHFSELSGNQKAERVERIEKYLYSLIDFLQHMGCHTVLLSMYARPDSHLSWDPKSELNYLSILYERVATATNSTHINIAEVLTETCTQDQINRYLLDDVHLNKEGAEQITDLIYKQIIGSEKLSSPRNNRAERADLIVPIILNTILAGSERLFESSLLSFSYDKLSIGTKIDLPTAPGRLVGLFYLNDPFSGWIRISTDLGEATEIKLFDHQSYLPRLHYRSLPELEYKGQVSIEVLRKEIDYSEAIDTYFSAKTFDPTADWAKKKYLEPLLQAKNKPEDACFKPALLIGGEMIQ